MVVVQVFCITTCCFNMGAAPMLAHTLIDWENSITTTIKEPIHKCIVFLFFIKINIQVIQAYQFDLYQSGKWYLLPFTYNISFNRAIGNILLH